MKKLIFGLLTLWTITAAGQSWTPIAGKQRFGTGLGIPVKDSTFFLGAADTALIYINKSDTTGIYWRYKGIHQKINGSNYTTEIRETVKAGEAINKGQAVYISGADGTNAIVMKASNASEATSSKTLGLLYQNLANNAKGFVITEGRLSGLNTSGATAGDPVWLGTNGNLLYGLANKPVAPAHLVYLGVVTRVNTNNGEIFVHVQNGFELEELHNVSALSPSNNDGIFYNTTTSLWEKKSISTALGFTPLSGSGTSGRVAFFNGTNSLTSDGNFLWDNTNKRLGIGVASPTESLSVLTGALISTPINFYSYLGFGARSGYGWDIGRADTIGTNAPKGGFYVRKNFGTSAAQFVIDTSGKVGIGYTAPAARLAVNGTALINTNTDNGVDALQVRGSISQTSSVGFSPVTVENTISGTSEVFAPFTTVFNSTSLGVFGTKSNHHLGLITNNSVKASITPAGQFNIGGNYTSTNNTLQVAGNAAIGYTTAAPTNGLIVNGNVGIGTFSPTEKLHVSGGRIETSVTGTAAAYLIAKNTNGGTVFGNDGIGGYIFTDWNAPLLIYTNSTERMRITSGGIVNVLSRLNVNGATDNANFELNNNGNLYTGGISPTVITVNSTPVNIVRTTTGYYCAAGASVLNLPAANGLNNTYYIINDSGGNITVNRAGADTILNLTGTAVNSITIADNERAMFYQGGGTQTYLIFQS